MEVIADHTFSGKVVLLDDKHFVNCNLEDCRLIYSGGAVIFEQTSITRCHHIFHGAARATVLYLQKVGLMDDDGRQWTDSHENVH